MEISVMVLWIVVEAGFLLLRAVEEGRMIQIRSDCQRSSPTLAFVKKHNRLSNVMSSVSPLTKYIPNMSLIIHFCVLAPENDCVQNAELVVRKSRDATLPS